MFSIGQLVKTIVELDGLAIGSIGMIIHVYQHGNPSYMPKYKVRFDGEDFMIHDNQIELYNAYCHIQTLEREIAILKRKIESFESSSKI